MSELTPYVFQPSSLTEAMEYAKMIANSSFCPETMRGKPGDVLIAIQMGAEIGLTAIQAIQNIAIIKGKPCVYGDAALAVVQASPKYEYHKEWFEGSIDDGTLTAFCLVKRKGSEEYTRSFGMKEAKKAALWSKAGVWQQYPDRMLQMRARSFATRDQFSDALKGISFREEVEDYEVIPAKKSPSTKHLNDDVSEAQIVSDPFIINEESIIDGLKCINDSLNMDELKYNYLKTYTKFRHANNISEYEGILKMLTEAKDQRKNIILQIDQPNDKNNDFEQDGA